MPCFRDNVYDLNEFSFFIRPQDTLLVTTVNKGNIINKQNKPVNTIGKMLVVFEKTEINLTRLLLKLGDISVNSTYIFSINLREDIKQETFYIKSGMLSITYIEIGVNHFIEMLTINPLRFYFINKKALYILRDGTYSDLNYILSHIGKHGINLGRGGSQKAHIMSPLELRFMAYLMAMYNFDFRYIYSLNTFNVLPKLRYLPFYKEK